MTSPNPKKLRTFTKYAATITIAIVLIIVCSILTFVLGVFLGRSFREVSFQELAQHNQDVLLQTPTGLPEMQLPKTFKEVHPRDGWSEPCDDISMGEYDIVYERHPTTYETDCVLSANNMAIDQDTFLTKYLAQLMTANESAKSSLNHMTKLEGWILYKDNNMSVYIIQYQLFDNPVVETHIITDKGLWRRTILGWEPNPYKLGDH